MYVKHLAQYLEDINIKWMVADSTPAFVVLFSVYVFICFSLFESVDVK